MLVKFVTKYMSDDHEIRFQKNPPSESKHTAVPEDHFRTTIRATGRDQHKLQALKFHRLRKKSPAK